MLTVDLVRVRRRGGRLCPAYLRGDQAEQMLERARVLIDLFAQAEGKTLAELDDAIKEVCEPHADQACLAGFVKLLKDRCDIEQRRHADAESVRSRVFLRASSARRALGIIEAFDRAAVVHACADDLDMSSEAVEEALFCDLPGAQVVSRIKPISAHALLHRYNLALAQGVLLRATRVVVELAPCSAIRLRQMFRAIKFHRLMHQVSGDASSGYRIVLDGPLSLFEATQRYGLQLALFLPTLVAGEGWSMRAEVRWGKPPAEMSFDLSDRDGLVSHAKDAPAELEEVAALERSFCRLETAWKPYRETAVFDIPGKGVFVPDLVFVHGETQRKAYLEVFGYWSRAAVFHRVEMLESGFPERVILAVSRRLRVSEEIADQDSPGRILVYANSIPPYAVRKMLDEIVSDPG